MLRSCDVRSVRSVALDWLHVAAVAAVAIALMATEVDSENFMMNAELEDGGGDGKTRLGRGRGSCSLYRHRCSYGFFGVVLRPSDVPACCGVCCTGAVNTLVCINYRSIKHDKDSGCNNPIILILEPNAILYMRRKVR